MIPTIRVRFLSSRSRWHWVLRMPPKNNTDRGSTTPQLNWARPFPIVVRRRRSPAMATSSRATSR